MRLTFWQYTSIALAVAVILLGGCYSCEKKKVAKLQYDCDQKLVKADTIKIHDTLKIEYHTKEVLPVPYKVETERIIAGKDIIRDVDTAKILKDYYSTAFYSTSQELLDSAEKKIGDVRVDNEISQNRIKKQRVFGSVIRVNTETQITKTIEAKQKNKFYWGLETQIPIDKSYADGGASVLFAHKKGLGFEVGTLFSTAKDLDFNKRMKIKVGIKKQFK